LTLSPATRYQDLDMVGADFSQQDLSDCEFMDCNFTAANFRACDLRRAVFTRCQFNNAASEQPADFSQANLREACFSQCNLTVVDFVRCRGYELIFENCQLQGADLSKSDFRLPIGNTELTALTMRNCNFSYGNLANNYLQGCIFTDCRMLEACFDYCDLTDADFQGSQLHNINAVGITLTGADLRGCSFNNVNPRDIDLHGVRIYHHQLADLLAPLGVIVEDDPS
jgi:fluoroquinolone resistance protein